MANFGAKYPVFAPFKGAEPTDTLPKYDTKTVLGKLVSANLTVNLSSGTRTMKCVSRFQNSPAARLQWKPTT